MAEINVGEISEALNDKMDRDAGNTATLGKERIVGWSMPDLSAQYTTSTLPYTVPKNSYVIAYGQIGSYQAQIRDTTNNAILTWFSASQSNSYCGSASVFVEAGTEITVTGCNNNTVTLYITPIKGL